MVLLHKEADEIRITVFQVLQSQKIINEFAVTSNKLTKFCCLITSSRQLATLLYIIHEVY